MILKQKRKEKLGKIKCVFMSKSIQISFMIYKFGHAYLKKQWSLIITKHVKTNINRQIKIVLNICYVTILLGY